MSPELTTQERDLLIELLSREMENLGPEIRHTDDREYRVELRERRQLVRDLLARLEHAEATT
ncbi:MAG: hypothetical protein HY718_12100 [Planctomycetes bacterium]|nr:hypothetical protein [Planctomycetota bacterium]